MPVYDARTWHTDPGDPNCPFSPPAGFCGDEEAYLRLMRQRYRRPPTDQLLVVFARLAPQLPLRVHGRFHRQARQIAAAIQRRTGSR